MKTKVNLFQASMLRWRDLYPYIGVHVVQVSEPLDAARLARTIAAELEQRGLTGLELDRRRQRYEWRGGAQEPQLSTIPAGIDAWAAVRQEIERQLNIAFPPDGRINPFRFFAIDGDATFHLGVAYDHFIAGGDSIVRLLGGIVRRYRDAHAPPVRARAPRRAPGYARLFARQAIPFIRGLGSLAGLIARSRRAYRPRLAAPDDGRNAFTSFRLDRDEHAALIRTAADWDVTQNDLFVAMLMKAFSPLAIDRRRESKRNELAIASIVNVRRDFGRAAEDAFVPLLASFHVSHPLPDDMGLRELVAIVHAETERVKRRKLYLQMLLAIAIAGMQWRFLTLEQRQRFFAKHYPVWAGTTPLNVTRLWPAADTTAAPPEYLRGGSTGPLTPMVVALTTAGEVLHVGISFRTTAFERHAVDGVVADILSCIRSLR